jgi:mannose-1-phosphate guanylyltransferase
MQPNRNSRDDIAETRKNPRGNPVGCALVLAGGEGKRLRPFVHLLRRDLLPKQYVNFIGRRSMLEHTLDRAERLVPRERVFTVINRGHLIFPEVSQQMATRHPGTVIVQPENKETAPGILFPLIHIAKRYPDSIVTLLPSDHFVLEEEELLEHVSVAQQWVKRDDSRIMLLGVRPDRDESEYGYIVPGCRSKRGSHASFQIASFVEKPDDRAAQALARDGALWNTMIMVFKTATLMTLIEEITPQLSGVFRRIYDALGTAKEAAVVEQVYRELPPLNFSRDIIEPLARSHSTQLLALPVDNVLWSDWGSESRIMEILRQTGYAGRLNGLAAPDPNFGRAYEPMPFIQAHEAHFASTDSNRSARKSARPVHTPLALAATARPG